MIEKRKLCIIIYFLHVHGMRSGQMYMYTCSYSSLIALFFLIQWISVEPNDGFGTLLPHETVPVDIIFSPDTSKDYSAKLTCKTAINK